MGAESAAQPYAVSPGAAAAAAVAGVAGPVPCLLVNPRSFAASRASLAERAAQLVQARGLDVFRASDPGEIAAAIDCIVARRQQRIVVVLGGDGTVQAAVDRLASLPPDTARPHLFVLGGGRSNLTAADFGERDAVLPKLDAALRRWREGPALRTELRHVLAIEQAPQPARHGFLVAAGLIDYAIRACHRDRRNASGGLRQGDAGTGWSVLKLALAAMLHGPAPPLDALRIEVPGHGELTSPARLLIATTLQRHQGLLNPFAERGQGPVRFTALAVRGARAWARLPWIALGRFTPAMDAARGYLSGRCDAMRMLGLSRYTLDGEEFEADPARPVVIRKGLPLTFLVL